MDFFGDGLRLFATSRNVDAMVLYNLARTYQLRSKYARAMELYRRALISLEQWQVCDATVMLAILFAVAQIQYHRNEHNDSLKTYDVALSLATDCFGTKSVEVAACWNCIGVVKYIMPLGDSDQALEALLTSLNYRQCLLGETHLETGTTYNNIGRVHFQRGDYVLAMEAYENALRIRRAVLGESIDVAATIFNMGQSHHQLGDRVQAMRLYHEFLTLAKAHFGGCHRDIAIVMTCIGQVHHEDRNFQGAMESFQEALRVGRTALGPLHPEIAITLNKVGNLYYELGNLDAALQVYRQGLTVEETVLDAGNANILVTLTNIAEIHKQRAEFDNALQYYHKLLALQRSTSQLVYKRSPTL
ncbi:protein N-acetylglucosaminyltransferase [Fragilaria crotonensis]|nr:protein N-acetylglucosaminyltransferase [Fragilaria crotonensis]